MENVPNPKLILLLLAVMFVECGIGGALVLLPFGFDHRSEAGLDFEHLVCFGFLYFVSFLAGVVLAVKVQRWGFLASQIGLLFLVGLSICFK
jgi:hypothetical protein